MTKKATNRNKKKKIRLNRFLAMSGVESRRKCDELIAGGEVKVNGEVVTEMGVRVDPDTDVVEYQGRQVGPAKEAIYILLNKPPRVVTTASDDKKRKTVLDVVNIDQRIFPVGRLDFHTTGALLLTNDGEVTYFLSHPRFEVSKIYRVLLDKRIRPVDLHYFQHGIELNGKKTAPCRAEELRIINNASFMEVELHEGRNRQIRRMFHQLGYQVEELHRIAFDGLHVTNMKEGEWRVLTQQEIKRLKELVRSRKHMVLQEGDDK